MLHARKLKVTEFGKYKYSLIFSFIHLFSLFYR